MSQNHRILEGIKAGDVITATWLNQVKTALNANTRAINGPKRKISATEQNNEGVSAIADESFSAGSTDITSTTVTITDSNGDTHDIERIDEIVFTEDTSGRTMTLSITYT